MYISGNSVNPLPLEGIYNNVPFNIYLDDSHF
nr:MAG TPA: hypothetical protein [Bacteriophage sp.]